MKILININRQGFEDMTARWTDCEGIKLKENPDGSFDLWLTGDLEAALAAEAKIKAAQADLDAMLPKRGNPGGAS